MILERIDNLEEGMMYYVIMCFHKFDFDYVYYVIISFLNIAIIISIQWNQTFTARKVGTVD